MRWDRDNKKVSELYEMYQTGELQLQPFFQRNLVWTQKAKSQFIESILLNLPISEVYLYENDSGALSVIDGQQRLSTIFHFLEKEFSLSGLEKLEELNGYNADFSEVSKINDFKLYFVKIEKNVTREEIIDTYSRINRYTVNLNAQELRKAAYSDSGFLHLSEELSQLEFFQYGRFFTERKRERMNDVEFISELLACQFDGIQDKKNKLDTFYVDYEIIKDYADKKSDFIFVISEIERLFSYPKYFIDDKKQYLGTNSGKNLGSTRYRQQADFYSLFYLMKLIKEESIVIDDSQLEKFLKLLLVYDYLIEPESDIDLLSEYAVKCVSQGNTKNSRIFRYKFLRNSLDYILTEIENDLIKEIKEDFSEIFDYHFEPLDINLEELFTLIDDFYEELEEDD